MEPIHWHPREVYTSSCQPRRLPIRPLHPPMYVLSSFSIHSSCLMIRGAVKWMRACLVRDQRLTHRKTCHLRFADTCCALPDVDRRRLVRGSITPSEGNLTFASTYPSTNRLVNDSWIHKLSGEATVGMRSLGNDSLGRTIRGRNLFAFCPSDQEPFLVPILHSCYFIFHDVSR